MVGFLSSLRKKQSKEEENRPKFLDSEFDHMLEFNGTKIDFQKFVSEIKNYLEKNDNPFDYTTYTILELPENKGICFKIEYGSKNPTFTFYITLEQIDYSLKIFDHIPSNYSAWAEIGTLPGFHLHKAFNSRVFRINLWNFIEKSGRTLEK